MMDAEELLSSLERRGFKVRTHRDGGITIVPHHKLTAGDREGLRLGAMALERLVRERDTGRSPADAVILNEAQRQPRRRSDRRQPDLTLKVIEGSDPVQPPVDQPPLRQRSSLEQPATPQPEPLEAVVETFAQDTPSHTSTVEPTPVMPEIVASEVVNPSTQDEPAYLTLEIDAPKPEPEAPAADPAGDPELSTDESSVPAAYDSDVTDTGSPEPDEDPLERKEGIIWVTIAPVRNGRQKIRVNPSPIAVRRDRPVRLCVEEIALSGVDRFRLLQGPATLWREVRLVRVGTGLRLAIVL